MLEQDVMDESPGVRWTDIAVGVGRVGMKCPLVLYCTCENQDKSNLDLGRVLVSDQQPLQLRPGCSAPPSPPCACIQYLLATKHCVAIQRHAMKQAVRFGRPRAWRTASACWRRRRCCRS